MRECLEGIIGIIVNIYSNKLTKIIATHSLAIFLFDYACILDE